MGGGRLVVAGVRTRTSLRSGHTFVFVKIVCLVVVSGLRGNALLNGVVNGARGVVRRVVGCVVVGARVGGCVR